MRGCTLRFICTECGLQDRPCILRGVAPLRTLVNYCHIISVGACGIAVKFLCERLQATCSSQHLHHTLFRHIGADTDVPAGDIGVGGREIGFLFGQYKRLRDSYEGVLTGKGLSYGGSLARTQATGYGLLYLTEEMLRCNGKTLEGKTVVVSGAGNVATYAIEKAWQLGAKPVTCSDSNGWIYDPDGIDVATLIDVKQVRRARLTEYAKARPNAVYHEGKGVWSVKCDVALPCATQNELLLDDAKALVANGCFAVAEGANMPTTLDATKFLQDSGILFCPGKAANAG